MNKFKKLTKIFSIVLASVFSVTLFAGCANNQNVASNSTPVVNQVTTEQMTAEEKSDLLTDNNTNNEEASNVSETANVENQTENNEEINEKINPIYGFYEFTKDVSFDDVFYNSLDEVLEYFEAIDINGVYDAANDFGFREFVKSITSFNDEKIVLYFNSTIDGENTKYFYQRLIELETKKYVPNNSLSDLHNYTIDNNNYTTSENDPTIEYDNTTKSIVLTYQFTFNDENGNLVKTPIFVKTYLSLIDGTEHISPEEINVQARKLSESSYISLSDDSANTEEIASYIATKLSIETENQSTENLMIEIFEHFDNLTLAFSDDYKVLQFINADNILTIINIDESTNTYNYNGLNFKLIPNKILLKTNVRTIELLAEIENNAVLSLTFEEVV